MYTCLVKTENFCSDILKYGLSNYESLPRNNSTTILTCCDVTDIDMDGDLEILVGSSAKVSDSPTF